jgi:small subunit ribosomal protein S5
MKKEEKESKKKEEDRIAQEPIEPVVLKVVQEVEDIKDIEEKIVERRETKEEKWKREKAEELYSWKPKTRLGLEVKEKRIKDIDEIFDKGQKIMEEYIVDTLIPNLQTELLSIGQAKGKFGGGKKRFWKQTQKKTAEGNVIKFSCMAVVGDSNGHVGIGIGKASETLPAKEKAIRKAKLNIIKIKRGCGSFDCSCEENHSIPLKVKGKVSSSVIVLIPAPKGTGLVIDDECKKIMRLAGIRDIYSRTFGQTRSKINLANACIKALEEINKIK